jgi:iron complex outermembrane receptor protein
MVLRLTSCEPDVRSRPGIRPWSAVVSSILGMALAGAAHAQEAPAPAEGSTTSTLLEEITITGTRIKQREDYVAPNPISTFNADDMLNLGLVNVSDAITQMPANVSTFQAGNLGFTAFFVGSTLANLRGLNPFFGTRTLTLVDTRRFVPTNQGGSVDLNFIPSVLIERMDVVTGGASAAYGSEAVSGVVNILLDHDLTGVKAEFDYAQSTHGDGDDYHAGLAGGMPLFGGRGHIVVGGEFQKSEAIRNCVTARDWCARGVGIFRNGPGGDFFDTQPSPHLYPQTIPGWPQHNIVEGLRRNQINTNGVIFNRTAGAPTTLAFNDAGTGLVPFNIGLAGHSTTVGPSNQVVGGDGRPTYDMVGLRPEIERAVVYSHMTYDFTDSLRGFLELSYGQVEAFNHQDNASGNEVNLCISADNAFLTPDIAAVIAANAGNAGDLNFGCPAFGFFTGQPQATVSKDYSGLTDQAVSTDTEVKRVVLGLSGLLTGSWTWDAYATYGETKRAQIGHDYRTNHRFTMAVDAVIDNRPGSPTFGQPVCRVTRDGLFALPFGADPSLAEGCRPLNLFGANNASPEALAYAFGDLTEFNVIEQQVVAASVTGELFDGVGAGPWSAAFGAEYRHEELTNDAGPLPFAQRTDFNLQYGDSFAGEVDVTEAFVEVEMPLLREKPAAKVLAFNAAARWAEYTNEGGEGTQGIKSTRDMVTWKLAGVWEPVTWLRFRGSQSRDIRAAGFRELYYSQSIPSGGIFGFVINPDIRIEDDPDDPTDDPGPFAQRDDARIILSGNPRLKPERADTTTIGFVLSPGGWADGLRFSADYYRIDLVDGIVLGSSAEVVRQCFDGSDPSQCDFLEFGPPHPDNPDRPRSNIEVARSPYINANPYKATGIDFALDYSLPLSKLSPNAPGSLAFRLTATRALETLVQSGNRIRDIAGQTGGDQGFLSDFAASPDWAANLVITYMRGPLTLTTQARYTDSGVLDLQTPKYGPDDPLYAENMTNSVTSNRLPSHTVWNLSASYNFQVGDLKRLQVFGVIDNVFDKEPPFSAGVVGGVNGVYFDTMGRMVRMGVRMEF